MLILDRISNDDSQYDIDIFIGMLRGIVGTDFIMGKLKGM